MLMDIKYFLQTVPSNDKFILVRRCIIFHTYRKAADKILMEHIKYYL